MTTETRAPGSVDELIDALVRGSHEAAAEGLVVSTSGNFSVRLDTERFAISAARTRLGRLRSDEVVAVDTSSGRHVPGLASAEAGWRPSRETPMHGEIYRAHPTTGAVLHFQSPFATILACREGPDPDLDFIPEVPVYVRKVARVPYFPPGTEALAAAVAQAFTDDDVRVVQLANHGQIVRADDPAQAVERATFFELACRLWVLSESCVPLTTFTPVERERLRSY